MHWMHSIDQLVFHIGSVCHTTDEYYRVLSELLEDRMFAIVSAFSESKRSESGIVLSNLTLKDREETLSNKLRAEATLIQNESRAVIAQPALDAARLEVWAIQQLISAIQPLRNFPDLPDPVAHQKIQYYENILDLAWKAFVEFKTYGTVGLETTAQLLARGFDFTFDPDMTRERLYALVAGYMRWEPMNYMSPTLLQSLSKTVNEALIECEPMQNYIDSFNGRTLEVSQYGIQRVGGSS